MNDTSRPTKASTWRTHGPILAVTLFASIGMQERTHAADPPKVPITALNPDRGRVAGRVVYVGPLPEETTEFVPDLNRRIDAHTVHVDPESRGLRDAVVYLDGEFEGQGNGASRAAPPRIDQRNGEFVPHVTIARAGRLVRFHSSDPGNHNIHAVSFERANTFNKYFAENTSYEHTFTVADRHVPVKLICDLHHWMSAWIYVFDHPYAAITEKDGAFVLDDVPPGRHTLVVHHADGRLRLRQPIQIEAGKTVELKLTLKPSPRARPRERR